MKLLIMFPAIERGGAEEHSLVHARFAVQQGWEVHVAFSWRTQTASLIRDFKEAGVACHKLEIGNESISAYPLISECIKFIRTYIFLKWIKPDVILFGLPNPFSAFGPLMACGLLRIPTLIVFHLIDRQYHLTNLRTKFYQWAKARSQLWVSVSDNNRRLLEVTFSLEQDEIALVRNGIDIDSFAKKELDRDAIKQRIRKELDIRSEGKILLTVGGLNYQKGYDYLIPTIPYILNDHPDTIWVWIGDGGWRERLEGMVRNYGIEANVVFLGRRHDVADWLIAADIFIFPTRFEGLPFALLEAMAADLPIISTSASGIPEIITHMEHGFLCRTDDSCDMLMATRYALENEVQMKKMACLARSRVQELSEKTMCEKIFGLLKKISRSEEQ